jgi:hypothetical protein
MVVVSARTVAKKRSVVPSVSLGGKLAALTGAAGAALSGEAVADPINYVPTAGVVAAQGIPGFSFNASTTTVTSGTLRPPAETGTTGWDVDGDSNVDFNLQNQPFYTLTLAVFDPLTQFGNPNGLLARTHLGNPEAFRIRNLANASPIGPGQTIWNGAATLITYNGSIRNQQFVDFPTGEAGYFGFRFAFGSNASDYYYGWASMTVDLEAVGSGFKITEAFYQSTPNTAINVGQVPVVPEPSSLALLAAGAAGVAAWRARKKRPVTAA